MKRNRLMIATVSCFLLITVSSFAGHSEQLQLQAAVRDYIEANMPWPQGTARVDFLSGEPEIISPGRNITLRIEPTGNTEFIGDVAFLVQVMAGGKLHRTDTVRTRIEVLRDIVVAARMIRSGLVITEQDVRLTKKWVRRISPDSVFSLDQALGKRITTSARPGMEFSAFMLKEIPLVQRGKIVRVVYNSGMMRITTVGMPEEDGTAGSVIRIRNITSNKIIYAKVMGAALVEIEI